MALKKIQMKEFNDPKYLYHFIHGKLMKFDPLKDRWEKCGP